MPQKYYNLDDDFKEKVFYDQDKKQVRFENQISKLSVAIALAGVLIAAIGLIPQFKSAFSSSRTEKISRNFSGRKVESIVEEVAGIYFDDVRVQVEEKDNGGKNYNLEVRIFQKIMNMLFCRNS